MNKRKQTFIVITTILTVFGALFFSNIYAGHLLVDTAKNMIDTTSVKISDLYSDPHFLNVLATLPFHDHYRIWDTTTIHPYHYDLTHMKDTVTLVLADHKDCAFAGPIAGIITSDFGPRRRHRYHYGIDLHLRTGDTVRAAFDGMVRISQYNHGGYGNCVVIRHYNGLETLYAHLSERDVRPGQIVHAGDVLGLGGSTGHSTGPHLHFEVRYKGEAINPTDVINFDTIGYSLKSDTLNLTSKSFRYLTKYHHYAATFGSDVEYHGAYTIHKGDTLGKIASNNGTTINRICQLNHMSRTTTLKLGRRLRLR